MNCKGCGWCCENLTSLKIDCQEFERLCNEIPHLKNSFKSITEEKKTYILNVKSKGCPFYNREQKNCSIYEKRPFPCRIYPIHLYPFKYTTIVRFMDLKDLFLEKPNEKTVEDESKSLKYNGSDYYYPETIDLHLCNRYYTIKRNDIIKLIKETFDYFKKMANNNIYGFSNELRIEESNPIYYLLNHFYIYRHNN